MCPFVHEELKMMNNTLFMVDLPLVETDEEVEKVEQMYPRCDSYFIRSGCDKWSKLLFDKLWENFHPYADSNFLEQAKTDFHQRSWEMYVGNVLLEKEIKIESKDEGPDFVTGEQIYIECAAPTRGDSSSPDSVSEPRVAKKPEEVVAQDVPVDKMILRITQAISDKAKQYKGWKNKNWFNPTAPFVIAVNTGGFGHRDDDSMPHMLKALFGVHYLRINTATWEEDYSCRIDVIKENNSHGRVSVDYFLKKDFSFISGVLFSRNLVIDSPESIGGDCFFVNNPFADNPVPQSFPQLFKRWSADRHGDHIRLNRQFSLNASSKLPNIG